MRVSAAMLKPQAIISTLLLLLSITTLPSNASELSYYLPDSTNYLKHVPTPKSVLGYEVGEWHARPEQIDRYLHQLAAASDRVKLVTTGYTYEQRPLLIAFISSPENINNLEQLRLDHLANKDGAPLVTWLGHSVHGNEASGANSSLLTAYHLSAATDAATLAQLDDQIIMIDPMINPDGLARFANWANMYRSKKPNADPLTKEHNENWPGGRTNHYWFDLNRDWLLAQHPESQARLKMFHQWRPNVLTDHHEMGTNSTFFFQPGVENRANPLTQAGNFPMTVEIGKYHARALDKIGSLYYSQESFDDFYIGKGSSYPDVHGAVGILFEQASSRGHVQKSNYGNLTFPFAIRNHMTTALSTVEAVQNLQQGLRELRAEFVTDTAEVANADRQRAIVFSSADQYRLREMQRILTIHQVEYYALSRDIDVDDQSFSAGQAYIIPLQQPQYRLIKSIFESRKSFANNIFYDVSAWNMGFALDVNFAHLSRSQFNTSLMSDVAATATPSNFNLAGDTIALAFDWSNFAVANLLSAMQQQGLTVLGTTKPISLITQSGEMDLPLGSIILPLSHQKLSRSEISDWFAANLDSSEIEAIQIVSGLAVTGVDMGSPSLPVLKAINPLLIIGDGVRSYDAGEVWHLMDQRLAQPMSMMSILDLAKLQDINQYTHLILVDGSYNFNQESTDKIEAWVKQGGVIIAHSGGASWLTSKGWTSSKVKKFDKPIDFEATYAGKGLADAQQVIGGAIAMTHIDITHPLGFGLDNTSLAVFKRSQRTFETPKEAFVGIANFIDEPHAAGYMSAASSKHIAGGTSIMVQKLGKGNLISFSDNPLFRAFFLGTAKVFTNALYYGSVIRAPVKSQDMDKDG